MPNHKKPTIDELDENINKTIEELEKDPDQTPENDDGSDKDLTPDNKPDETPDNEEPEETPEEEDDTVPETPEEKKPNGEAKKQDYEKRYRDSSTEAQILYAKSKKITDAIEKAGDVPEPTEEELVKEYPEWEEMSDFEKKIAKNDLVKTRKLDAITEATKEFKDMDSWSKKIDEFLAKPETMNDYPELEGKEDEFKIFTLKPTRVNVDFPDLVSAFLYAQTGKPKKKGQMFETGTGGSKENPKPKQQKLSVEDSRQLRNADYKKYLQYLREGKIAEEV